MKKKADETTQLAIRLPVELVERITAHTERMKLAAPGVGVARADAIRSLLLEALALAEARAK